MDPFIYSSSLCLCVALRVQRPLLHAGNPGGTEPPRDGGEEGEKVQLQEAEGEAGETLQHQGGVTGPVHPGDRGQARDPEPGVGRTFCVVSLTFWRHGDVCLGRDPQFEGRLLSLIMDLIQLLVCLFSHSEIDDVHNDLLHLDIW